MVMTNKPIANNTINNNTEVEPKIIISYEKQSFYVSKWLEEFKNLPMIKNNPLSQLELQYSIVLISELVKVCFKTNRNIVYLNINNFLMQIRDFAKLELTVAENELFIDFKGSKYSKYIDVIITKQFQATQKLAVKYCTKNITHFKDGIVYDGDIFEYHEDFVNGLTVITKHEKGEADRTKFENIKKAYAIAYTKDNGSIIPYVIIIDKKRIDDARKSSVSISAIVWSKYLERMVRKTTYWCLFNDIIKPYLEMPLDIKEALSATDKDMDFTTELEKENIIYDVENTIENIDYTKQFIDYTKQLELANNIIIERGQLQGKKLSECDNDYIQWCIDKSKDESQLEFKKACELILEDRKLNAN